MPLSLVELPLDILCLILDHVPVYCVEQYALTCKLLFSISSKLIEKYALKRAMYSSIYCGSSWNEHGFKPILLTLLEPERCVYARKLCVDLDIYRAVIVDPGETTTFDTGEKDISQTSLILAQVCQALRDDMVYRSWGDDRTSSLDQTMALARARLTNHTDEKDISETSLILAQVCQTLRKDMVHRSWGDRALSPDMMTALALARLINLTKLEVLEDGNGINDTIDMIGYAATTQWSERPILQHLTEIRIQMKNYAWRNFGESCGVVMSLPSLRKLHLFDLMLDPIIAWSERGVAPLSYLGLSDCGVASSVLREMLYKLQHLKTFIVDEDPDLDPEDGFVNTWDILGIIRESGLQSSLTSLTLNQRGLNGPSWPYIGSLEDFESLEDLEIGFANCEVDDSTFPHFYASDILCDLSVPSLKTLSLRYFMDTDWPLQDSNPGFHRLTGKFLRQMPMLRHLHIDSPHASWFDDRRQLLGICEDAGVLLSM